MDNDLTHLVMRHNNGVEMSFCQFEDDDEEPSITENETADEIDVTPEMRDAGTRAIRDWCYSYDLRENGAEQVYRAMERARRREAAAERTR